jgi:crotonobetainyl-CoA:carnitine CoA-transferase CaiB-like acyl-CoA transferase
VKVGPPVIDFATAYNACFGILAALRVKEASGVGQKISVSLLDTAVGMVANFVTGYIKSGVPIRPAGGGHPQIVPYQTFRTNDGWIVVACLNERFWNNMCSAIGRPELAADARFARNPQRMQHREELTRILDAVFSTRSTVSWEGVLREREVPVAPIHRLEDMLEDPQVVHNGAITVLQHPRHGGIPIVANALKFSATPSQPRRYPPSIGEHTEEVLLQAGYARSAIDELRASGVVRCFEMASGAPRDARAAQAAIQSCGVGHAHGGDRS